MFSRVRDWWRTSVLRRRFEEDLSSEIDFHLQSRSEELVRQGYSQKEARRTARMEFGSLEAKKEDCREARGLWWLDEFGRNFRYAARTLIQNRAFSISAIMTLGLCIGANTAIFSLVDAVLFRPLPYPDPERLQLITTLYQSGGRQSRAQSQDGQTWELIRDHSNLPSAVFSGWRSGVNLSIGAEARHVQQQRIGTGFFALLGTSPLYGRGFTPEEDREGGPAVVILSHSLARSLFDDPAVALDQEVDLRGEPHLVIGVMPGDFITSVEADLWTPLRASVSGEGGGTNYQILVRIPPEMSIEEADARVRSLSATRYPTQEGSGDSTAHFSLLSLQQGLAESLRASLNVIWAAVGLVLLIGCVNIAALLMARNRWRSREMAIRMALGGGRSAVVRQLLTESLGLAIGGGLVGLVLGYWAKEGLQLLVDDFLLASQQISLDARTLVVMAGVSLATSVLFGLIPALQAGRVDVQSALSDGGNRGYSGESRQWSRRILVVAQTAMAVVLLVAAGLLMRTFFSLVALDPGFEAAQVITAKVSLQDARYQTAGSVNRLFDTTLRQTGQIAGIQAAGIGLTLPYERALNMGFKRMSGPQADTDQMQLTNLVYVVGDYFTTLNIALQEGRNLGAEDRPDTTPVVVVNEAFAKAYLSQQETLGSQLGISNATRRVVGVVADVQQQPSWGNFGPLGAVPTVYLPLSQTSDAFVQLVHTWFAPTFVVKTPRRLGEITAELQQALSAADPQLPLFAVREMEEVMERSWARQRVQAILLMSLAALALLLSGVGVYGLIANSVVERRREMGIRLALGSPIKTAVRVLSMPAIVLTLAGLAVGTLLALAVVPAIEHLVWGVGSIDPLTYGGVALILLATAALAGLIPSLQVAQWDPARILREE